MCKLFYSAAMFVAAISFVACEETKFEDLASLQNTLWESTDHQSAKLNRMEFNSGNAARYTQIVYDNLDNKNEVSKVEYDYSYVYDKPTVTMTPLTDGAPALSGKIICEDNYNYLSLTSADGELFFAAFQSGDLIWQK